MNTQRISRPAAHVLLLCLMLSACSGGSGTGKNPIVADSKPIIATVTAPGKNSIVKSSPTHIVGTLNNANATVTVAGIEATVASGEFSASVPLAEGDNSISIVATANGTSESTSLNVTLNTTEMCGSGDTFTVALPGLRLSADPSTENLPNRTLPDDSVTLPNGCDMYAIIVHGYGRNDKLDELMYYRLAKFVAENNGYVHWSWWNNLLGEYMAGPLHDPGIVGIPGASPGNVNLDFPAFLLNDGVGKGVPDEDFQFQADAERVLAAIRQHNPDAVIIVAGHSMGGNAVARLGANTTVDVDLLAPIDPVGNRNSPVGVGGAVQYQTGIRNATPGMNNFTPGNQTFNWNRWRAIRTFRGFKQRDCVRNNFGLCKDFDSRLLWVEYRCTTYPQGSWLSSPPLVYSRKPLICPRSRDAGPIYDRGRLTSFRSNIKRLYHRWQLETYFPYDWDANYHFGHAGRFSNTDILAPNFQAAVQENPGVTNRDLDKTCLDSNFLDPRGAVSFGGNALRCRSWDGHGEIIGMRAVTGAPLPINRNLQPLALTANPHDWPFAHWFFKHQVEERRAALIQMASTDPWPHRPDDPFLDLVVDDMVDIARNILDCGDPSNVDDSAPSTTAIPDVDPNEFGWNNTDVVVTIAATDESCGSGAGVKEIVYELTGAETGSGIHQGDILELMLTAEGTTTLTYFARDNAGFEEEPNTLVVMIDKTPPTIDATIDPEPNQYDWNNTDVTVTFTAEDELSGVHTVTDPMTVTEEGANQEVIGVATDRAGNSTAIGVILNIDKTPPIIGRLPEECSLWPPNHKLVEVAEVTISDELSGIDTSSIDAVSSEPESGPGYGNAAPDTLINGNIVEVRSERYSLEGRTYDLAVVATDRAGNVAEGNAVCVVPHDQGK